MTTLVFICVLFINSFATSQPEELGNVQWVRDYNLALKKAKASSKDVLILFQEVPGCMTAKRYGREVLSDPWIVEAIETNFIPLAIYNNKDGTDNEVLQKYNEPAWNNPVIRLVDHQGKPKSGRLAGSYEKKHLLDYLLNYLSAKGQNPEYLHLYAQQLKSSEYQKELVLSMYCFWTGEKELGSIAGVINTTSGFMHGKEVVKVIYDSRMTNVSDLINHAQSKKCADAVFSDDNQVKSLANKYKISFQNLAKFREDKDQNYYLKNSKYAKLELFDMQAMKINTALGRGQNPDHLLSPRQIAKVRH